MLVPTRSLPLYFRFLHTSQTCSHLIAPPDPTSNMRPTIYDDAPPPSPPSLLRHPYSLSEFMTGSHHQRGELELQFKLQRQQLDAFHQNFWLDVCPTPFFLDRKMTIWAGRVTLGLQWPKKRSLLACPPHLQSSTKKMLFLSFTNNGVCKRQVERTTTQRCGEGEIFPLLYLACEWSTKKLQFAFQTLFLGRGARDDRSCFSESGIEPATERWSYFYLDSFI